MSRPMVLFALAVAMCCGCAIKREEAAEEAERPRTALQELVVCNGDERDVFVFGYDTSASPEANAERLQTTAALWHWHPHRSDLSRPAQSGFRGVNECKPVIGGKYILITSSWRDGGLALIRRSDKKTLYCATKLRGAHSAEVLPDGNIVVAASGEKGFLRVYKVNRADLDAGTLQPAEPAGTDVPLPWGHGVVWDRKGTCLWALGGDEILQLHYARDGDTPALKVAARVALPEGGGHDLFPMLGDDDRLMVSTSSRNWLFSPATRTFTEFSRMTRPHVKSMSRLPANDLLVTVAAEKNSHAPSLIFTDARGNETRVPVAGATFYKARWLIPNDFSY